MNILTVNLLFSTLLFWIAARLYVVPKLAELPPRSVLPPVLLLHEPRADFRHRKCSCCMSMRLVRSRGCGLQPDTCQHPT